MAEFTHKASGVRVSVADGKALGPEWVKVEDQKPKPKSNKK